MTLTQPGQRTAETRRYTNAPKTEKTLCLNCLHRDDKDERWCERFQRERVVYIDRVVVVECGGHTPCKS